VADNDDVPGMTPDDALDAARFDEERFDDVTAALAELSFLRPTSEPTEPMPDWAWERLSLAIGSEATARAVAAHDNVVPLSRPTKAPPSPKSSRGFKWAGGLVAASVAVVAVGVAVSSARSTTPPPTVVAGEAVQASSTGAPASIQPRVAQDKAVPASPAPGSLAAGAAAPTPQSFSAAGESAPAQNPTPAAGDAVAASPSFRNGGPTIVPAARIVTATHTDYQAEQLPTQVRTLLSGVGVDSPKEASAMPVVPTLPAEAGFTSTWQSLRDCITWLTHAPDAQALVVDRGTFEGDAAGVVVAPAEANNPDPSTPPPTASVATQQGMVDVWVVTPQCTHIDDAVNNLMPYAPAN
jgi:hypothetical protein